MVEVTINGRLLLGQLVSLAPFPRKISVVSIVCFVWYSDAAGIKTQFPSRFSKSSAVFFVNCLFSHPLSWRACVPVKIVLENTVKILLGAKHVVDSIWLILQV